jgi:hypothetical protein
VLRGLAAESIRRDNPEPRLLCVGESGWLSLRARVVFGSSRRGKIKRKERNRRRRLEVLGWRDEFEEW